MITSFTVHKPYANEPSQRGRTLMIDNMQVAYGINGETAIVDVYVNERYTHSSVKVLFPDVESGDYAIEFYVNGAKFWAALDAQDETLDTFIAHLITRARMELFYN